MIVVPYDRYKHGKELFQMLNDHGMSVSILDNLPEFGLVAHRGEKIIAAGFIRKVEGSSAMLDSYITNPRTKPESRDRALDLITYKLIQIAKKQSISQLVNFSSEQNIITRAQKHGFIVVPHQVSVLLLNPKPNL